jgi:hypothetical protein
MIYVTKTFSYPIADDYTHLTDSNDSSSTWTYKGPRYIDIELRPNGTVVDAIAMENADEWTNTLEDDDHTHMLVDANTKEGALIAAIFNPNPDSDMSDSSVFPHISIALPDGLVYKRIHPPAPDHTYDKEKIQYDLAENKWKKPFPYFPPFQTWAGIEGHVASARALYTETVNDSAVWNALNADTQQAWHDWDSDLEHKVAKYKAAGLMPHNVVTANFPGQEDPKLAKEQGNTDDADSSVGGASGVSGGRNG